MLHKIISAVRRLFRRPRVVSITGARRYTGSEIAALEARNRVSL